MTSSPGTLCAATLAGLFSMSAVFAQTTRKDGNAPDSLSTNPASRTHSLSNDAGALVPITPAVNTSGSIKSGVGLQGNLAIDPINVNFGGVVIGSVSSGLTVTFSNDGTASLDVTALSQATAECARSGGTCSENLPISIEAGSS